MVINASQRLEPTVDITLLWVYSCKNRIITCYKDFFQSNSDPLYRPALVPPSRRCPNWVVSSMESQIDFTLSGVNCYPLSYYIPCVLSRWSLLNVVRDYKELHLSYWGLMVSIEPKSHHNTCISPGRFSGLEYTPQTCFQYIITYSVWKLSFCRPMWMTSRTLITPV